MRSIDTIVDMKAASRAARAKEQRIGFVPTMGALHEGHVSLVRRARGLADVVVMSIFVNPSQFGPSEDYNRYPRDLARDAGLAAEAGVDILFTPEAREIYPAAFRTYVDVEGLSGRLEGASRPGHFRGVATVVLKLFQIVEPDIAVFGQKDAQQTAIVKRLAEDLDLDVEVVVAQTVREKDGLAMASRNVYLSPAEREAAPVLWAALKRVEGRVLAGELDARVLVEQLRQDVQREPLARLDYAEIVSADGFEPVATITTGAVAVVAARIGSTRLIDNLVLHLPAEAR